MFAAFLTRVHIFSLYTLSLSTVRRGLIWVNCVVIKYNQITITWNFW